VVNTRVTPPQKVTDVLRRAVFGRFANSVDESVMTTALVRRLRARRATESAERLKAFAPVTDMRVISESDDVNGKKYSVIVRTRSRITLWEMTIDRDGKVSELDLIEEE
jgi:hypothetical protein